MGVLGWTEGEFWRSTPHIYLAACRAHGQHVEALQIRADHQAGVVASTIANVHRGRGAKAFTAQDFMPQTSKPKSRREVQAGIRSIMKGLSRG